MTTNLLVRPLEWDVSWRERWTWVRIHRSNEDVIVPIGLALVTFFVSMSLNPTNIVDHRFALNVAVGTAALVAIVRTLNRLLTAATALRRERYTAGRNRIELLEARLEQLEGPSLTYTDYDLALTDLGKATSVEATVLLTNSSPSAMSLEQFRFIVPALSGRRRTLLSDIVATLNGIPLEQPLLLTPSASALLKVSQVIEPLAEELGIGSRFIKTISLSARDRISSVSFEIPLDGRAPVGPVRHLPRAIEFID